ncbi:MAG: hypothetical protein PHV74_07425 [Dehalococcoidia bacterium]|nr:hypothetical protein [Dehalococcoidia bacterium]
MAMGPLVRITVEIPEELARQLDAEVERTYSTRRAVICQLLETLPQAKDNEKKCVEVPR